MSEVWLTHSKLTPAHDFKCARAAIGTWIGSGWQVREDQSDPAPDIAADEAPADDASPAPPVVEPSGLPTAEVAPDDASLPNPKPATTKKGG